jgi:acetyl-CoA synthetase
MSETRVARPGEPDKTRNPPTRARRACSARTARSILQPPSASTLTSDEAPWQEAEQDLEGFWTERARELEWMTPWTRVMEWSAPDARWFVGGRLNVSANCLDRHVRTDLRNKAAIIWEGEPGDRRTLTYWDLHREVNKFGNALKTLGVVKGDRVAIYLPLIPEAAVAMLACARIGAIHTVVFGGFSAESLRDRINDARAKVLVTADGGYRRGAYLPLKHDAEYAVRECPSIEHVVVVKRGGFPIRMKSARSLVPRAARGSVARVRARAMDSEDPLYILYTSGTTGSRRDRPHDRRLPDGRPRDDEAGSSICARTTSTGAPPTSAGSRALVRRLRTARVRRDGGHVRGRARLADADRFWEIIERLRRDDLLHRADRDPRLHEVGHGVAGKHDSRRCACSAPSASRSIPRRGSGTQYIGGERCPIVDTWWQTETGMIMITPLPGRHVAAAGLGDAALPRRHGRDPQRQGRRVETGGGYSRAHEALAAMLRGIWGDRERFIATYFSRFPGSTSPVTARRRDEDGYFWLLGRVDDVLNVAGHRIGTMEVESALVDHPPWPRRPSSASRTRSRGRRSRLRDAEGRRPQPGLADRAEGHVTNKIGSIARPDQILFSRDLPKTRSGRSCAGSCATSRKDARSATRPPSRIPAWSTRSSRSTKTKKGRQRSAAARQASSRLAAGRARGSAVEDRLQQVRAPFGLRELVVREGRRRQPSPSSRARVRGYCAGNTSASAMRKRVGCRGLSPDRPRSPRAPGNACGRTHVGIEEDEIVLSALPRSSSGGHPEKGTAHTA